MLYYTVCCTPLLCLLYIVCLIVCVILFPYTQHNRYREKQLLLNRIFSVVLMSGDWFDLGSLKYCLAVTRGTDLAYISSAAVWTIRQVHHVIVYKGIVSWYQNKIFGDIADCLRWFVFVCKCSMSCLCKVYIHIMCVSMSLCVYVCVCVLTCE